MMRVPNPRIESATTTPTIQRRAGGSVMKGTVSFFNVSVIEVSLVSYYSSDLHPHDFLIGIQCLVPHLCEKLERDPRLFHCQHHLVQSLRLPGGEFLDLLIGVQLEVIDLIDEFPEKLAGPFSKRRGFRFFSPGNGKSLAYAESALYPFDYHLRLLTTCNAY